MELFLGDTFVYPIEKQIDGAGSSLGDRVVG